MSGIKHSAVLVAAALLTREPHAGFRSTELTHFINGGCADRFSPPADSVYPAQVRKRLLALEDKKLVRGISFGRFHITDRGWAEVLELTGGRWLL